VQSGVGIVSALVCYFSLILFGRSLHAISG